MGTLPGFESIKQTNILGQEYWSARDLMVALGYDYWQNFEKVISKAMTALISPEIGLQIENHFVGTNKMDAKLQRDNVQDEDTAIITHHDVGQEVRQAMENIHQKKPEDLPRAASIRKLVEEKRRKTRKKLKSSPPPDEQDTLF